MVFIGRRVLVVEDEFLVSMAVTDLLESVGCLVVGPAANVAAGVRLARSESLDAAVLDMNLAGELVWPVAEELQRQAVRFLFLSAYPRHHLVPEPFAAITRLEKPLENDQLLRWLGRSSGDVEPISRSRRSFA